MKKLFVIFKNFGNKVKEDNLSAYAASCAFFIFLSLVPMLILICAIIPFTPLTEADVLSFLSQYVPRTMRTALEGVLMEVYERSAGILSIAAITTLWSAGKGVNSLINGLNAIENYKDKRNGLLIRLVSCLYTLIFLVSIVMFLLIVVFGKIGANIVLKAFPNLQTVIRLFIKLRVPVSIIIMTLIIMLCYALLPYKKGKLIYQVPGAFFTSIAWSGFSYFFALYLDLFDAFGMYGSLATIIILLVWLYILMYLVLLGANLNKYFNPVIVVFDSRNKKDKYRGQRESLED